MRLLTGIALVVLLLAGCSPSSAPVNDETVIPKGAAAVIDGSLGETEWSDAASQEIKVEGGSPIRVLFKHDGSHLYVAFRDLKQNGVERFAEILLSATGEENDKSYHWLHASYNDCEEVGKVNLFGSCKPTLPGWEANNYPLGDGNAIEMKLSFEKAGLKAGQSFAMAFAAPDKTMAAKLWPETAEMTKPPTWAKVRLQ